MSFFRNVVLYFLKDNGTLWEIYLLLNRRRKLFYLCIDFINFCENRNNFQYDSFVGYSRSDHCSHWWRLQRIGRCYLTIYVLVFWKTFHRLVVTVKRHSEEGWYGNMVVYDRNELPYWLSYRRMSEGKCDWTEISDHLA